MAERFSDLPDYAFPRLRSLLAGRAPGGPVRDMTIGGPQHPVPDFVADALAGEISGFGPYPKNEGSDDLLDAISGWLKRRYGVEIGPERILALNGTREGLYNAAMALLPEEKAGQRGTVLTPNPFYQVYMVAAMSVTAEPVAVAAGAQQGFLPDYGAVSPEILARCVAVYICSPSNPQGAIASKAYWRGLLDLAERHDFLVFADECYSEIYRDDPPPGVLEVAAEIGSDPERVVAFHSLSKRSNLAGLRSGFAVAGPEAMARMRRLRAYAGAPLPGPLQAVAARAWRDDDHVATNRALYREKYAIADRMFAGLPGFFPPRGGFFLWLPVEDGEAAAVTLWDETGVRVLPGAYLGRGTGAENPGQGYIRAAMVAPAEEVEGALSDIRGCLYQGREVRDQHGLSDPA